jgi:hypothetical protein
MNKPKYTSLSAFIKGVQHVDEKLTDGERLTMFALLGSVDYKTACSRPGNRELMSVTDRGKSGIHLIIRSLKSKGLIEITEMGNGRGHATVYRFCVEDERYPEPRKKPSTSECTDMPEKASTPGCTLSERNRPVANDKGSTSGSERVHSEARKGPVATDNTSLESLPQRTSTTPSSAKSAVAVGSVSKPNPTGKEESGDSIPDEIKKDIDDLRDAFRQVTKNEYGIHELSATDIESMFRRCEDPVNAYTHAFELLYGREKGWGGLSSPQVVFVREFRAQWKEILQEVAEEEKQKAILADVDRQMKQHTAKAQAELAVRLAEIQAEEQEVSLYNTAGEPQF